MEIKHHVVKRSDTCEQVHMMEAMQEPDEPIRTYVLRLRKFATTCNFYSRCGDEYCTNWYIHRMLLLIMLRGLYDQGVKRELLFQLEDMDIDSAITFIEEREDDRPSATVDTAQEEEPPPEIDDEGSPPKSATEDSPLETGDEKPLPETTDEEFYAR